MAYDNTVKAFSYALEADGLDQFLVQEMTLPEVEVATVEHFSTTSATKTAGLVSISDMEIKKIKLADSADNWAWDWIQAVQNPLTGTGGLPSDYKRNLVVREFDAAGRTTNRWILYGCWVKKVSTSTHNRAASENVIETVTFSVDSILKVTV